MISYDEIMMKYVEGKLVKMYDWILKNLENDPEVIAGEDREKENLRKFLQEQVDVIEEYIQAGGIDDRDNQDDADIFGEDDIVTSPASTLDEKSQDFLKPDDQEKEDWQKPQDNDDEDDDDTDTMPGWD